jgi:rubredoxin
MKWKCGVCGFIHDGNEAPDKCPKCGAPKEKFTKLTPDEEKLIDRSRLTNSLHMKLASLLEHVSEVSKEGVEDALDPACVAIFTKASQEAHTISQMIKAEIQTHISKGKWG